MIDRIKNSVRKSCSRMESYRMQKLKVIPFSELELSLGFAVFIYWLDEGIRLMQQGNREYIEAANDSARQMAITFIASKLNNDQITQLIRTHINDFNSKTEYLWAKTQATHKDWDFCLTRALILICRALAYDYTGTGQPGFPPDGATGSDILNTARQWVAETLGTEGATLIFSR